MRLGSGMTPFCLSVYMSVCLSPSADPARGVWGHLMRATGWWRGCQRFGTGYSRVVAFAPLSAGGSALYRSVAPCGLAKTASVSSLVTRKQKDVRTFVHKTNTVEGSWALPYTAAGMQIMAVLPSHHPIFRHYMGSRLVQCATSQNICV
jgi:hypothetical protein